MAVDWRVLRGNEIPEEAQVNLLDHCARLSDVRQGLYEAPR